MHGRAHWSTRRARILLTVGGSAAAAMLAAACSSSPSANTPATSTSTTTPTTAVATTTSTVPLQTATGGEFFSPTKNISCEIDDTTSLQLVYCQTMAPPQSVTMKVDGTLTKCAGEQCLGNPGAFTPALPYGSATGTGPFRCLSSPQGMSCTVTGGKGFQIATGGITSISG